MGAGVVCAAGRSPRFFDRANAEAHWVSRHRAAGWVTKIPEPAGGWVLGSTNRIRTDILIARGMGWSFGEVRALTDLERSVVLGTLAGIKAGEAEA